MDRDGGQQQLSGGDRKNVYRDGLVSTCRDD
jgi:hypothetical protein